MPYLRGSDGTVYRYTENPVAAWTPEEWEAELARLRAERDNLQAQLDAIGEPPKEWPEEAKALWWMVNEVALNDLRYRIDDITSRLAEMESV